MTSITTTPANDDPIRVKLPVFEGPLDLLLYLVKSDEVNIYDIQISRITQQYLNYLAQMQELNLEIAGEFLVMAANLIYLKSRTLLPVDQQAVDDQPEEEDPRWELIRQLVEYKKFKEAASHLQGLEEAAHDIFHRTAPPPLVAVDDNRPFLGKLTMWDLMQALQRVIQNFEEKLARQGKHEVFEEIYTVSQKIEYLLERIAPSASAQFFTLFAELASRAEIVVTFLALLELIRLKQLRVEQSQQFEDIAIYRIS